MFPSQERQTPFRNHDTVSSSPFDCYGPPLGWDCYVPFADFSTDTSSDDKSSLSKNWTAREQWHAFWEMAMPYFREQRQGRWMFFILFLLMLLNSAVIFLEYSRISK